MKIGVAYRAAAVACSALCVALAACSGAGGPATTASPAQPLLAPVGANGVLPHGATLWHVNVGGNRDDNAFNTLNFFTDTITIDEGDSIEWTTQGEIHTVTFFGRRTTPIIPIFKRYGDGTYNGEFYQSSGFMVTGQTYTLKFTKAGTFPYQCLLHGPVMAGTVIVQRAGTPYPHPQSYYDQQGKAELTRELDAAVGSLDEFPYTDGGTQLALGISPGLNTAPMSHSTVLRFLDADNVTPNSVVTIARGTTLTWTDLTSNEPHTVTFPIVGHVPPPGENPFGPPSGGTTYDGKHPRNSGALFPGQSYSLTFTAKGTFKYYCLFHDDFGMIGTVVVK